VFIDFGDDLDRIGPYQYANATVYYEITELSVTQIVPEPATGMALVPLALAALARRRRA
jgi:hypothetical protein